MPQGGLRSNALTPAQRGFVLNRGTYAILVTFVEVAARQPVIAVAVAELLVNFTLSRRLVFR